MIPSPAKEASPWMRMVRLEGRAGFPACQFGRLSNRSSELRTGRSGELADRNVCPTSCRARVRPRATGNEFEVAGVEEEGEMDLVAGGSGPVGLVAEMI